MVEKLELRAVDDGNAVKPVLQLAGMDSQNGSLYEEKVHTPYGDVLVSISGNRKKPALVTYHDIGQNANTCFQGFLQFSEMASLASKFCIFHINAPGQEEDASPLPDDYMYPTMDDLSSALSVVLEHFKIKSFVGFGVGAGANILARFALRSPKQVNALILVNCTTTAAGWVEWGYQKMNISYLAKRGMTNFTVDYLMWHHFGKNWKHLENDLVQEYHQYFSRLSNPRNLAAFIDSYIRRTDLCLRREGPTMECPILQIVGGGSPHVDETVDTNSKLHPSTSDWMKISDCGGLVLDECPDKVTEAIMLFLQGQGYLSAVSHSRWVAKRQSSVEIPTHLLPGNHDSSFAERRRKSMGDKLEVIQDEHQPVVL